MGSNIFAFYLNDYSVVGHEAVQLFFEDVLIHLS